MKRKPKFGVVVEQTGEAFVARVVRRRTSCGTTIEREQSGFEDRSSAMAWGEVALTEYLAARESSKARKAKGRIARRERDAWLSAQTLQILAELSGKDEAAISLLKYRAELLWAEVSFRALKRGDTEGAAIELANRVVGRNWTQRLTKAMSGDLDHVHDAVTDIAIANASRLAQIANAARAAE